MCGIFGSIRQGGDIDVSAALLALQHRGPDGQGIWRDGDAVLGHTRLAIIDLSAAASQPMLAADGSVAVVFNGEIYNHHALRDELARAGHEFRSRSDTEVIVEGYRAWGDDVIHHLDGMFAIGLWDTARRRLLLARDRAGKKPLFYVVSNGGLRFASEIKALAASGIPMTVDVAALPFVLSFGYTPAPRTSYAGVFELPPASILTLETDGTPAVRRYWTAPFCAPSIDTSEETAIAEVRKLTEAAVARRLEADVPLGAFLSGGIDSTIIVGLMSRLLGSRVKTFSIGFAGDAAYDETHFARIAAAAFDTDHTEFRLDPVSFDLIESLVALHDGPFGDSSAIPTSVVAGLTRQHVTVALTGDGGDELFCGYVRFLATEAVEAVPLWVRHVGRVAARLLPRDGRERSVLSRMHRLLDSADAPLARRLTDLPPLFAASLDEILRPEVRSSADLQAPLAFVTAALAPCRDASILARVLEHNFESYLPYDLLVKADRCSMLHGLETRSPFLDRALVEYAARLPDNFKRRGLSTKWVLKRAFGDLIPPQIAHRRKMGFGVPLAQWFRGDLRGYLLDQLAASSNIYDYLNRAHVERLLEEHMAARADHSHRLWLLLTFAVWLRSIAGRRLSCAA
jgi:asparagine synthase (glutamine-hydrolysing)